MFNKLEFSNAGYFLNPENPVNYELMFNTTTKWSGSDNVVNFKRNQPNPYGRDDITYQYNERGFRSDSFDSTADKRIVFIGCSMTEGTGLAKEDTWSYILLDLIKKETGLNIPYWNLGLGGCGLDAITRLFYHYSDILKPNLVFGLWPCYRREFKVDGIGWDMVLPSNNSKIFEENPILTKKETIWYETEKNLAIIDLMIGKNNSTLIWDYWDRDDVFTGKIDTKLEHLKHKVNIFRRLKISLPQPVEMARDGLHPGKEFNKQFALTLFYEKKDVILEALL
jgi:hypothetical protein